MATQTGTSSAGGKRPSGTVVSYDRYIEMQLRKTRSQVRNVDIAGELMVLSAGTLAYFLAVALVDHWVIPGGLGTFGRALFLGAFVAGVGYYFVRHIAPLLLRRINPLYAAHTIETSKPSLKNSLVNFLMFRQHREALPDAIYQAIEEQAATNLAKVPLDSAVDHSKLIKIAYVLLGVLLACAIYKMASPKDPLQTLGRIVMPWADIQPATRVAIVDVQPGNGTEFTGQKVTVSAEVRGARETETVRVLYATADGQTVDEPVTMQVPPGGYRYTAVLPAGDAVLEQDLKYRIEAGDAVSREYALRVVAAPTIVVEKIDYNYPDYTGLYPRTVEHQGDIKAIEGTEITVHALANQEIESASIDFDCNNHPDVRMEVDGKRATAKCVLGLKPDGSPEHVNYQLLFKNVTGQSGVRPLEYQIEVTPDLPPLVEFTAPAKDEMVVPFDRTIALAVEAKDPDFALSHVHLIFHRGGKLLLDKPLLDKPWRGKFQGRFVLEPRKWGLKNGDKIEYWAVAEDDKSPKPNRTETPRRHITIVSPGQHGEHEDQLAQNDPKNQPDKDPAQRDHDGGAADKPQPNDQQEPGKQDEPQKNLGDQKSGDPQKGDKGEQGKDGEGNEQGNGSQRNDSGTGSDKSGDKSGDSSADKSGSQAGDKDKGAGEKSGGSKDQPGAGGKQGDNAPDKQPGGKDSSGKDGAGKDGTSKGDADKPQDGSDNGSGDKNSPGDKSGSQPNQPVNKDGSDDAEAFNRLMQQLQKDEPEQAGSQNQKDKQQDSGGGKNPSDQKDQGDKQPDKSPQKGNEPGDGDAGAGDQSGGDQSGGDQAGGGGKAGGSGGQSGNGNQSGSGQKSNNPGQSGNQKASSGAGRPKDSAGNNNSPKDGGGESGTPEGTAGEKGGGGSNDKSAGGQPDRQNGAGDKGQPQPSGGKPTGDAQKGAGKPDQRSPENGGVKEPGGDRRADQPLKHDKNDRAGGKGGDKTDQSEADAPKVKPDQKNASDQQQRKSAGESRAPGEGKSEDKPGTGNDAQGNADPKNKPSPGIKPGATGGEGEQDSGSSGAGQPDKENEGSPSAQDDNKQRNKKKASHDNSREATHENEAQSPSGSKHETDTEGETGGDQSGGGRQGGGQKANKPGTGGSGQNTAADQGAGRSPEAGDGESTNEAGGNQTADHATGKRGTEKGNGSTRQPGTDKAGGESTKEGGSSGQSVDNTRRQKAKSGLGTGQGPNGGGGTPGEGKGSPQLPPSAEDRAADAANLEYTRKATDLALERLKHQIDKNQVDQKLLDSLGWTPEDLRQFVRRWEAMRREAKQSGPQGELAKRELDEALRSLGLRPRGTTLKSDSRRDDEVRGLKESQRSRPPSDYAEQYKAYTQGTARGGK